MQANSNHSQKLGQSRWEGNQRGSGIKNDASVVKLSCSIAKGNGIKIKLPVRLASQWDLGHLASIVGLVNTTEHSLRLVTLIVGVTKEERDYWLIEETLIDHTVEWWDDLVNTDGVVSKTHDAIKSSECKGEARLLGSFGKVLVLDFDVTNLNNVLRNETAQAT